MNKCSYMPNLFNLWLNFIVEGIMETKPRLLDQVRNTIRMRHYSLRTEESYIGWIKRYIFFHNKRHPKDMGEKEINEFLTNLAVNQKVAASTQNQAFNALLFLYREILKQEFGDLGEVVRAKKPRRLPVVFTMDEIRAIINQLEGSKWLMAQLMYGSGLRVMECVRLRVKDIDFAYRQIVVREGKGGKDRITMLPDTTG
jgi:integrase